MLYSDRNQHYRNDWILQINRIQVTLYFFDIMKEQMVSYQVLQLEKPHVYQVFNRCS